jgi:hypothetical protein
VTPKPTERHPPSHIKKLTFNYLHLHVIVPAPFLGGTVVHDDVVEAEDAGEGEVPAGGVAADAAVDNDLAVAAADVVTDLEGGLQLVLRKLSVQGGK